MAFYRHYGCPDCGGTFRFLHYPADEPPPNFCPLCGSNMTAEPRFVPQAPHIAKSIGRTADRVYRQTEEASSGNMAAAAELAGGDAADYAALKVTDLADYLRPGDVAAKMPSNVVAQQMANSGQGGFRPVLGMTGAEFAAGTAQGAFPRRGEATRQHLVAGHPARAGLVETAGRLARSK